MTYAESRDCFDRKRRDPAASTHFPFPPPTASNTEAICPSCGESFGNRAAPSRRSKFNCKKCAAQVHTNPNQQLFPSVYLTDEQASLVDYLGQLDRWVFTAGSWRDFCWAKQQIGKSDQPNTTQIVADAIWWLLNYNHQHVAQINPDADEFMQKTYREDINDLIHEFRSARKKSTTKRRKTSK